MEESDAASFEAALEAWAGQSEDAPENSEVVIPLLRLERAYAEVARAAKEASLEAGDRPRPNPTMHLLEHAYRLAAWLRDGADPARPPAPGTERALVWSHPRDGTVYLRPARDRDLLALKIVVEGHDRRALARTLGIEVGAVDGVVREAEQRGLVLPGRSRLVRDGAGWPAESSDAEVPRRLKVASSFTLQWHITHACDLHCKHCYDRTRLAAVSFDEGVALLDDLWAFCDRRNVRGHVCFSGGNPFFHPRMVDLYAEAVARGFETSILGNPVSEAELDAIIDLQMPRYFQVSLEGLEAANDAIRGAGNFRRVLDFLDLLRERQVPSAVMLTLTRANLGEVLPLAKALDGRVDRMTFNRLAQVGEGKHLLAAPIEAYAPFLREYLEARRDLPHLRLKDNLFNILLAERGEPLMGGCTGFGCGAAFNFLAILPTGEAYACRKFPSPVGNVLREGLEAVYASEAAAAYRRGCRACDGCALRPACGGCLAVVHGSGRDPLTQRDPYCFYSAAPA
ncbi:MAG: selenobiotic family peptide radical SAM maturase [Deltaproteobacteria bacterium]|nr:MAG: selenobiotic family peptide radical SAM maturase [Deltaproteobacteria bacterium]